MRICLAMGLNIKLSFVICHFSDDNAPLFGDKFSLFSDNQPCSDGAYRGAFLMRKKVIFLRAFLGEKFGNIRNFLYLCSIIKKAGKRVPDVDGP